MLFLSSILIIFYGLYSKFHLILNNLINIPFLKINLGMNLIYDLSQQKPISYPYFLFETFSHFLKQEMLVQKYFCFFKHQLSLPFKKFKSQRYLFLMNCFNSYQFNFISIIQNKSSFLSMRYIFGNAKPFQRVALKCVQGYIPKSINGNYFRNGPGLLHNKKSFLNHWFQGNGFILNLSFTQGTCSAQGKFVQTPLLKKRRYSKNLNQSTLGKLWRVITHKGLDGLSLANTSVLALNQSDKLLALCEGSKPYVLHKEDLKTVGDSDFGWLKAGFSAHPKIDPDNGDIFNFGFNGSSINIFRATKNMEKICQTQFKLRNPQSIHDFCLAGDYLVFLEAPTKLNISNLIIKNKFFYDCYDFDQSLPTLVHIYSKDLKHIKTANISPFFSYHFSNGYSTKDKIVVQYIKYDLENTKKVFDYVENAPKLSNQGQYRQFYNSSQIQQLTIDLNDFSTRTKAQKLIGDFPVVQDSQVGKEWRYTYGAGRKVELFNGTNAIYKYDRKNGEINWTKIQERSYYNEPCPIRAKDTLYLLSISNKFGQKTYAEIFQAENLEKVCKIELPEFVPAGFHGKWQPNI